MKKPTEDESVAAAMTDNEPQATEKKKKKKKNKITEENDQEIANVEKKSCKKRTHTANEDVENEAPAKKKKKKTKLAQTAECGGATCSDDRGARTDDVPEASLDAIFAKKKSAKAELDEEKVESGPQTAYVDGIPYTWSVEDIKQVFVPCGKILDVRAPTWQDSGRLMGYAHIDFATVNACLKAVAKSGHKTGNGERYLRVQGANAKKQEDRGSKVAKGSTLFLKNLPYECNEDQVGGMFTGVLSVRIAAKYDRNKGFAYVDFKNRKAAQDALTGGPYMLKGRRLLVCGDVSTTQKAGFHYRKEAYESHFGPKKGQKKEKLF
eukprot:GEMP01032830.1.p1 GENE.GEMP01032830.1~~GEMP01032830.1.p1  ORF type:complete len:322 (+),score=78.34 GEMP01032830.1:91-1056(+)